MSQTNKSNSTKMLEKQIVSEKLKEFSSSEKNFLVFKNSKDQEIEISLDNKKNQYALNLIKKFNFAFKETRIDKAVFSLKVTSFYEKVNNLDAQTKENLKEIFIMDLENQIQNQKSLIEKHEKDVKKQL